MADLFRIIPYSVRSAGTDVPPEEVQAAVNSLANQTTIALNAVSSGGAKGPAGGDLSGTYPNPTVAAVHATSGTLDGTVIGGVTPAAGSFTTLAASTPVAVTSGGTGRNALTANAVVLGEGSSQVNFAAPGTAGQMLLSTGAAADPAFANNPVISGGSIDNTAIGATTASTGRFTTITNTGMSRVIANTTNALSLTSGSATVVTTWTTTINTGANFVASTGVFTAPATAQYLVSASFRATSATVAANSQFLIQILVNGTAIIQAGATYQSNVATIPQATVTGTVNATSGQTITVAVFHTAGVALTLDGGSATNWLTISRLY